MYITYPNDTVSPIVSPQGGLECLGLTKRELFALAAMQGFCSQSESMGTHYNIAENAVQLADALIAELNK